MKKIVFLQSLCVFLLIAGCHTNAEPAKNRILGRTWKPEKAPATTELLFTGDGKKVVGNSGVNRFFAPVLHGAGGKIEIDMIAGTRMAGVPADMEYENKFIGALKKTKFIKLEKNQLLLLDADGGILLRFHDAGTVARP